MLVINSIGRFDIEYTPYPLSSTTEKARVPSTVGGFAEVEITSQDVNEEDTFQSPQPVEDKTSAVLRIF
jgi:hypothetical protein